MSPAVFFYILRVQVRRRVAPPPAALGPRTFTLSTWGLTRKPRVLPKRAGVWRRFAKPSCERDYLRTRRKGRNTFIVFCLVARTRIDFEDSVSIALPPLRGADLENSADRKAARFELPGSPPNAGARLPVRRYSQDGPKLGKKPRRRTYKTRPDLVRFLSSLSWDGLGPGSEVS
jgi:hypothetical protein